MAVTCPLHFLLCICRGRRLPTVVPTDSRPLSWPPIGALPRNRLASSATGSASPISPMPRLLHSLKRFRRAGRPHPADPDLHRTPCKNHVIARPVRKLAWQSVIPLRPPMPPAAPFLSAAKEREERTPPKPRFWNPFRGLGVVHVGLLLPRGPRCAKFAPCFRMVSAAASAGRSRGPALP